MTCPINKLCKNEDCEDCFKKSFASHPRSKCWSIKNGEIKPRDIFKHTASKYIFNCDKCNHEFKILISDITNKRESWCPFCGNKKLCDLDDCVICFSKSFANIKEKALCWNYEKNENISPRNVFKGAKKSYYFTCDKCKHDFNLPLYVITGKISKWCYYCSGKRLCDKEDCKDCFKKSFASHPRAKCWSSKNGSVVPRDVFISTPKKYYFTCDKCNKELYLSPNGITRKSKGEWCSNCTRKTQAKLFGELIGIYPDVIQEYKVKWCRSPETNKFYPFDFYIPSLRIAIEIDGPQHFTQLMNWETPERTQSKDLYKMKLAYDNGISIIRIPYEYIFRNDLYEKYKSILLSKFYKRNIPEVIYICEDARYEHFNSFNFNGKEIPKIVPK